MVYLYWITIAKILNEMIDFKRKITVIYRLS